MVMNKNPYPGLAPFDSGDWPFFGRIKDVEALVNLMITNRVVLLHSPSGAGKTSMIHKGLIPKLEEFGNFQVLPVIRVNENLRALKQEWEDLPNKSKSKFVESEYNRFSWSVLRSLESKNSQKNRYPLLKLANMKLVEYLEDTSWIFSNTSPKLLIFDQFEEVLTKRWRDVKTKEEFFRDLGVALRNNSYWVLFVVREDYVAALQSYYKFLPCSVPLEFRMELFEETSAKEAIVKPALAMGVKYGEKALAILLKKLRAYRRYNLLSNEETHYGKWVDPLFLQLACHRLWEELPPDSSEIKEKHVRNVNNLDETIAYYYSRALNRICNNNNLRQQGGRSWIGKNLIDIQLKQRRQINLSGYTRFKSEEIELIRDLHRENILVETRAGTDVFELAHDRMINPILENNKQWADENITFFERKIIEWEKHKRKNTYLLDGWWQIKEMKNWLRRYGERENAKEFIEQVNVFIRRSQWKVVWKFLSLLVILGVGAYGVDSLKYFTPKQGEFRELFRYAKINNPSDLLEVLISQEKSKINLERAIKTLNSNNEDLLIKKKQLKDSFLKLQTLRLATAAVTEINYQNDELGALLVSKALVVDKVRDVHNKSVSTKGLLYNAISTSLNQKAFSNILSSKVTSAKSISIHPNGNKYAMIDSDNLVVIQSLTPPFETNYPVDEIRASILTYLTPKGNELLLGREQSIEIRNPKLKDSRYKIRVPLAGELKHLSVDPNGQWLAVVNEHGKLWIWSLANLKADPIMFPKLVDIRVKPVFSNDLPEIIAVELPSSQVRENVSNILVFDILNKKISKLYRNKHRVIGVAIRPNKKDIQRRWLVSLDDIGRTNIWTGDFKVALKLASENERKHARAKPKYTSIAFDEKGTKLILGGELGFVRIWDASEIDLSISSSIREFEGTYSLDKPFQTKWLKGSLNQFDDFYGLEQEVKQVYLVGDSRGNGLVKNLIAIDVSNTTLVRRFDLDNSVVKNLETMKRATKSRALKFEYRNESLTLNASRVDLSGTKNSTDFRSYLFKRSNIDGDIEEVSDRFKMVNRIRAFSYNSNIKNTLIALASGDNNIWIGEQSSPKVRPWKIVGHTDGLWDVAFHPTQPNILASASWDKSVRIWRITPEKRHAEQIWSCVFKGPVESVVFDSLGSFLYTAARDQKIHRWEVSDIVTGKTNQCPHEDSWISRKMNNNIRTMAFSTAAPNKLAVGGMKDYIEIITLSSNPSTFVNAKSELLRGHSGGINDLVYSNDGKWLISASEDTTVRIWFTEYPQSYPMVLRDPHSDSKVLSVAYGRVENRDYVASGDADGRIRLWETDLDILAQKVCQRVSRNAFTNEEWNKYLSDELNNELFLENSDQELSRQTCKVSQADNNFEAHY